MKLHWNTLFETSLEKTGYNSLELDALTRITACHLLRVASIIKLYKLSRIKTQY